MPRRQSAFLMGLGFIGCLSLVSTVALQAQDGCPGRVFLNTDETIAIWEFNQALVDIDEFEVIPNDTIFEDLSGNGLDAIVQGNESGDFVVGLGSEEFDEGDGNFEVRRVQSSANGSTIVVEDDNDAFEMPADQSFSMELYVNREDVPPEANWGILAGTWVSRNTLDDEADPNVDGAWYGYGLIRNEGGGGFPTGGWAWSFTGVVDGQPFLGHPSNGQPTERMSAPPFEIPEGRHYLVFSVDREEQVAVGYVDGMEVTRFDGIDPTWEFVTPDEYEHANFRFFNGVDDPTEGRGRRSPAGVHIDAARVQSRSLTSDEVEENWLLIQDGDPVGDESCGPASGPEFRRGDPDDSGTANISDAVNVLNFLFASAGDPVCMEAADVNDDGTVNITDPVGLLNFLFGSGTPPGAPGHETCGPDPADSPTDLGCETYTTC